jgi:hypothetical protein
MVYLENLWVNLIALGAAYDKTLLIVSCGVLALIVASYLREKFIFKYPLNHQRNKFSGLFEFYKKYRKVVWVIFVILFIGIAATNLYFGIYQRGSTPRTILPFGLNGVYTWLLLFGATSISSILIHFEFLQSKKMSFTVVLLTLFESFFSNISMLSRGMVINMAAIGIGGLKSKKVLNIKISTKLFIISFLLFISLFAGSILIVTTLRSSVFQSSPLVIDVKATYDTSKVLIVDRWVGIEGVMAVSSYQKLGWELWKTAWKEKYSDTGTSFYDLNLINSPYKNTDLTNHHFISLPGLVAFLFYPGSYIFLFFSLLIIGLLSALVEISIYKLSGANLVFCALMAQVIAYRWAHFGYVPARSYMLFGTIYLNVFLVFALDKLLVLWYQKRVPIPDLSR